MAAAIEVENLTKTFRLSKEKTNSLKERVLRFGRTRYQDFQALEDINVRIDAGETVGLIGHNGSGKSTLLKCIAGIIQPTTGVVRTVGRMAALLELGAGFHPDLTGRENVYLNASILGLKRMEVDRVFDDIVGFSGLEAFIDSPVKHYSSGMYVRLGFAVAINVDPEILLVDEVLSVGDEAFQRKCVDKVRAFQAEGRTIVVVTHAAELVRDTCHRAYVLDHGRVVAQGEPDDAISAFRERLRRGISGEEVPQSIARSELSPVWGQVRIVEAEVAGAASGEAEVRSGEGLRLDVDLEAARRTSDVVVGIAVYGPLGQLVFGTNTQLNGVDLDGLEGRTRVTFHFNTVPLLQGTYAVTVGVHTAGGLVYDVWEQRKRFDVVGGGPNIGVADLPVRVERN